MSGLQIQSILDGIVSDALTLGYFESVNTHEPKKAPVSRGLTVAIWVNTVRPVAEGSGLAATSAQVVINARVSTSMLSQPQDAIDPNLVNAVDAFMGELIGGFTLSGFVRNIDVFGAYGENLSADAGYVNIDGKIFRAVTITIPCIVNDAWTESA
jgi:hypothetical protein